MHGLLSLLSWATFYLRSLWWNAAVSRLTPTCDFAHIEQGWSLATVSRVTKSRPIAKTHRGVILRAVPRAITQNPPVAGAFRRSRPKRPKRANERSTLTLPTDKNN